MVGGLLLRGMPSGVIAAAVGLGFAKSFGEPQVDRAIAFENQMERAEGESLPGLIVLIVQRKPGLAVGEDRFD